ncbi:hypothetical protein CGRA01v4_02922 [Colletotrichum graminicola]|nr:hypothetical protein CGRA01v4_02922 [Colletotrichum graminicola]
MVVKQVGQETWQGVYAPESGFVVNLVPVGVVLCVCVCVCCLALLRPNCSNFGYPRRFSIALSLSLSLSLSLTHSLFLTFSLLPHAKGVHLHETHVNRPL